MNSFEVFKWAANTRRIEYSPQIKKANDTRHTTRRGEIRTKPSLFAIHTAQSALFVHSFPPNIYIDGGVLSRLLASCFVDQNQQYRKKTRRLAVAVSRQKSRRAVSPDPGGSLPPHHHLCSLAHHPSGSCLDGQPPFYLALMPWCMV